MFLYWLSLNRWLLTFSYTNSCTFCPLYLTNRNKQVIYRHCSTLSQQPWIFTKLYSSDTQSFSIAHSQWKQNQCGSCSPSYLILISLSINYNVDSSFFLGKQTPSLVVWPTGSSSARYKGHMTKVSRHPNVETSLLIKNLAIRTFKNKQ